MSFADAFVNVLKYMKFFLILYIFIQTSLICFAIDIVSSEDLNLGLDISISSEYNYLITEYPGISSFNIDSAKLGLNGDLYDNIGFNLSLDFSEIDKGNISSKALKSIYVQYTFNNYFRIRTGQFKAGFGGENDLKNSPHLNGSEGSKKIAIGRARGIQLSGKKILNNFSYSLGFFNSGDYDREKNEDGHHIGTAKIDYKLKKKGSYRFNTGYSFSIGTNDSLSHGLYTSYQKKLKNDKEFFIFVEYLEERFFNYHWNNSLFASCALRINKIEPVIHFEYFDEVVGEDGEDDKLIPGLGVNYYAVDDLLKVRFDYSCDYLYSLPLNHTDGFFNHEFSLLMEVSL